MPRAEEIVGAYRDGGVRERMDIYLAHRGLRSRFDEIEREEEERGSPPATTAKGKSRPWRLRRGFAPG